MGTCEVLSFSGEGLLANAREVLFVFFCPKKPTNS